MRAIALGAALAGACATEKAVHCDDPAGGAGWECLDQLACARPPSYCGHKEDVDACSGKLDFQPCSSTRAPSGSCYGGACTPCSQDLVGCAFGDWLPMTSPTTNDLGAIWVADDPQGEFDAFAVGNSGTVLHYDGGAWTPAQSLPMTTASLRAVWGSDARHVFVVGGDTVLQLADGTWTATTLPGSDLYGVWGSSPTDVFAIDYLGTVFHFDGAAWARFHSISGFMLRAICGTSAGAADDLVVVGTGGNVARYDGSTWSTATVATSSLYSAWCESAADVFAVGGAGTTVHYDGQSWSPQSWTTSPPSILLLGAWGERANDVYAVGESTTGRIAHYDGTAWSNPSTVAAPLFGVAGGSTADVFAVGMGGVIVHHVDGM